jgi:acetolactate synthase-1/2/3 large subunit
MNASELFVKAMEAEGVQYIFGIPGEENLDLLEAIRKSSIKLVVTRHEQAAVFMAATFGRLTGKAGVALSTLGPGATNLVTGVAYAQLGGMPLLVITGQKPVRRSKQGRFQVIDAVRMMEPITKLAASIPSADRVPAMVREAFKVAQAERPGAVHLELPEDIAVEKSDAEIFQPIAVRRPEPDPEAVKVAAQMIHAAKHPLILIAAGANRKRVAKELLEFVEKTKLPFVTTQMGKGVVDETLPNYIGNTALSANDYIHCALDRSDLIIAIGHDTIEKPPVIMTPGERKVIHVNFYEADVSDVYVPSHEVIGDIALALQGLTAVVSTQPTWDLAYFERLSAKLREQIAERSDSSSFPIKPQRIARELREVMPSNGILALDNGMYKLWIARNYFAKEQNTVLLDNALATMGAGLPSAMAAKMLNPDKKVVAVVGDGGFMMSAQELETAMRLKLDLVVLILNDNGYGMIKWKQEGMGLENFGLEFGNPDFVKLADAFGAQGYRITRTEDFKPTLEKALNSPGIHLIDCPIDYSENVLVFNKELKDKTCDL